MTATRSAKARPTRGLTPGVLPWGLAELGLRAEATGPSDAKQRATPVSDDSWKRRAEGTEKGQRLGIGSRLPKARR